MRFFKLIGISFIVLFSLITCIGLMMPSTVIVSRATDISAPNNSVFENCKDLLGWKKWVNGFDKVEISNRNKTQINRSIISIISTKIDSTDSTIHSVIIGEWLEHNGDKQTFSINLYSNTTEKNKTIAQWQFQQKVPWYPWARFTSMVNDKVIGSMLEKNLASLKSIAEKNN